MAIKLTSPLLPELKELIPHLQEIFKEAWVTNNGKYLVKLEQELSVYLESPNLAVVTNGTMALDLVLRALEIQGEVITTGYTFPATYHLLFNNPSITPVFADIDESYCLNPKSVADRITSATKAILAVHAYGYPCDVFALERLAKENGLLLIYDAAPAFGVRLGGKSIARFGDAAVFSFHATKVYTTLEGGCVVSRAKEITDRVRLLRNFGIVNEEEISLYGINAKMDEVRAVIGLLNLKRVEEAIERRKRVVETYLSYFDSLAADDITLWWEAYSNPDLSLNYAYFPILIQPSRRFSRDTVYAAMRAEDIMVRKYYFPSIVDLAIYKGKCDPAALPRTQYAARNVLCLPVHHEMSQEDCRKVIDLFDKVYKWGH